MNPSKFTPTANTTIVFDRNPVSRLVSCAAAFGAGALLFGYIARQADDLRVLPILGLLALVAGTVLSALMQYGDRIYVSPDGLLYHNRWLSKFGRAAGWMAWRDVVEVREVRRKILILFSEDGRRLLVDAVAGYPIARREILRRTPHAIISGTLQREDRPRQEVRE